MPSSHVTLFGRAPACGDVGARREALGVPANTTLLCNLLQVCCLPARLPVCGGSRARALPRCSAAARVRAYVSLCGSGKLSQPAADACRPPVSHSTPGDIPDMPDPDMENPGRSLRHMDAG